MLEDRLPEMHRIMESLFSGGAPVESMAAGYTRDELCDFLEEKMRALEELVGAMSPAQLAYRLPGAPGGVDESGDEEHFDTSQIATHLATALSFHWWGMTRALRLERPIFPKAPEGAAITGKKSNGMGRGGWSGVEASALVALLQDATGRFLAFARSIPEGYETEGTSRYGIFGELSAHGWLLLAAGHPAMHLKQLQEMQAQAGYPQS